MKVNKTAYTILVSLFTVVLLAFGFSCGYILSTNSSEKSAKQIANTLLEETQKEKEEIVLEENKDVASKSIEIPKVNIYEEDMIKDLEIEYIDKYLVCGHETRNTTNVYGISIREFKEMQKEDPEKSTYKLIEEGENKLTYLKEHDQYCKDHYLVKIEDKIVVIYNIINEGICSKYKDTIIREETIRESLKKELKLGIRVDSQDELYSLLEDIES